MSSFAQWYIIAEQLPRMGWPKPMGLFRKLKVDTGLLDVLVEQAIQISVGLGAGRPQLGTAVLADIFPNNSWTKGSTADLLFSLKEGELKVNRNPGLPPWKAFYTDYRAAPSGKDIAWENLGDPAIAVVWDQTCAWGIYWGLNHAEDMPKVFTQARFDYEQTAGEAIPHGLGVSAQFPWSSLEHFYETCEEMVRGFEAAEQPLPEIPGALLAAPEVAARLGNGHNRPRPYY